MTTTEFNKLPRREKAILVAKDILKQIKLERYIPATGLYTRFSEKNNELRRTDLDIKENFNLKIKF